MKFSYIIIVGLLLACGSHKSESDSSEKFTAATDLGAIDMRIHEASGLVASAVHPGFLWTHNDSGNPPEVFLIDQHAQIKMVYSLNVRNRDWEDITIGSGPVKGKSYLYVGDIGDNNAAYATKKIYFFEEPVNDDGDSVIPELDSIIVALDDGQRDTETLMMDPLTSDILLVSKREDNVMVYRVDHPYEPGIRPARKIATLPFHNIVSGDISADGSELLLKDYDHIYYWKRDGDEELEALFMRTPVQLTYTRELQGEAIAWAHDGSGFYTLSETKNDPARLLFYKRTE